MTRLAVLSLWLAAAPAGPVPIVVAAADIPAGTMMTFDLISQRRVPGAVVTASVVMPDAATRILNRRIVLPVLAGDPMLWSFFETSAADPKATKACRKVLPAAGETADAQISQARAIALGTR